MIVKNERTDWINEYGYNEGYTWKEIKMSKTGHLWRGSAMETYDSCGNCDGGRCDSCRDLYEVYKWSEPKKHIDPEYGHDYNYHDKLDYRAFFNKEEAIKFYDSLTL